MYQQGKSHAGSFYNFNFLVQMLGHHKNDVIKSNVHRGEHKISDVRMA